MLTVAEVFLNLFIGFYYIIHTVIQCDLPPLRPHCGPGPRFEPGPKLLNFSDLEGSGASNLVLPCQFLS